MAETKRPIDQVIEEARAEGKFDDLEGKGRPLVLDTSPDAVLKNLLKNANVVPDWITLASEIEAQFTKLDAWIETFAVQYDAERLALEAAHQSPPQGAPAPSRSRFSGLLRRLSHARSRPNRPPSPPSPSLSTLHQRWDAAITSYAAQIHRLNHKIRRYNRLVPLSNRQKCLLDVAERLDAFVDRFPRFNRTEEGELRPVRGVVPESLTVAPPDPESSRMGLTLGLAASLHSKRSIGRRPPPIG